MIGWVATSFVIADDRNIEDSVLECGEDPVYAAFRWNTCKSMLGIALLIFRSVQLLPTVDERSNRLVKGTMHFRAREIIKVPQ
jgi:hypothetical protein